MKSTAFVFPGQGSQSVGMLNEFAEDFTIVKDSFSEASEVLGYDLWELIQNGPDEKLNQTEYTQAAMLTADVAVYRALQQKQAISATMMAGHSLGEYAALVCSDSVSLADAAKLVAKRGQLMQEYVPLGVGAMAAVIGLGDDVVREICKEASFDNHQVTPANYNAIGQVVIAGHTPAVERAVALAEGKGARMAKIIPVSVPCHCELLAEAAENFAESLGNTTFVTPSVPVVSNVDLSIYQSAEQIRTLLKNQLHQPVRWVETIQSMKQKGIALIIECGPGKVLNGLVKRIDKSLDSISINSPSTLEKAISIVNENASF